MLVGDSTPRKAAAPILVPMGSGGVARIVAVGASNLTRGFHAVVAAARGAWGPDIEVVAALGNGRSYGGPSTYLIRTLPGILESGLWRDLQARPAVPTRALVTDVGNDILYGSPPEQILAWVGECVSRLERFSHDIVLTGLPVAVNDGLSGWKFLFFRSLFYPGCRLTFEQTVSAARRIEDGLEALADERGLRFCRLRPEWYRLDPVHIRPGMWRAAWQEILCGEPAEPTARRGMAGEAIRLYCLQPERAAFLGVERRKMQPGVTLRAGGRIWLY
jgi:hypothetical protein